MLVPPTFTPDEARTQANVKAKELAVVQGLATEIKNMFGPPPILSSEDPKAFDRVLFALIRARCPSDVILKMCVWDIAVGTWHMSRIERVMKQTVDAKVRQLLKLQKDQLERQVQQKAERIAAAKSEAAATADLTPDEKRNDKLDRIIEETVPEVDALIANADAEAIHAQAFQVEMPFIIALDEMKTRNFFRRNATLQSWASHRDRGLHTPLSIIQHREENRDRKRDEHRWWQEISEVENSDPTIQGPQIQGPQIEDPQPEESAATDPGKS